MPRRGEGASVQSGAMDDNLTRDEAQARARLLSDVSYRVALDLTAGDETFRSETVVRFRCHEPGASTFVDLAAPRVESIQLNGQPVTGEAFDGHRIRLAGLQAENELRVVADCAYSRTGMGLHRIHDPGDGRVYLYPPF